MNMGAESTYITKLTSLRNNSKAYTSKKISCLHKMDNQREKRLHALPMFAKTIPNTGASKKNSTEVP
jgi:hypothetical protein